MAVSLDLLKWLAEFQQTGESSADNSTDLRVSPAIHFLNIFFLFFETFMHLNNMHSSYLFTTTLF